MVKRLDDLVGQDIVALVPVLDSRVLQPLKLLAVENAGIWVESPQTNQDILSEIGATMTPNSMTFFLPFAQISYILGSRDVPSISEKAAP